MFELEGKNGKARVYAKELPSNTISQIINLMNSKGTRNAVVRIMPDAHYAKGSTVGTTIKLPANKSDWYISPNVVGVDIGCGMMSYQLTNNFSDVNLRKIDEIIHKLIPAGSSFRSKAYNSASSEILMKELSFKTTDKRWNHINLALGSLGGGNHFIELAKDDENHLWLTVHSGSRTMGTIVAQYHQQIAAEKHQAGDGDIHLAGLEGSDLQKYLNDVSLAAVYAHKNREAILNQICQAANLTPINMFDSVHNYIDIKHGIIRKGATAAYAGQQLIIPLNMRDGSLICVGKNNSEWNQSAPHGAGRILGRGQARQTLHFADYQNTMKNVYSSTILPENIDESPMVYKPANDIIKAITDTVQIVHRLKPVYNFKA